MNVKAHHMVESKPAHLHPSERMSEPERLRTAPTLPPDGARRDYALLPRGRDSTLSHSFSDDRAPLGPGSVQGLTFLLGCVAALTEVGQ